MKYPKISFIRISSVAIFLISCNYSENLDLEQNTSFPNHENVETTKSKTTQSQKDAGILFDNLPVVPELSISSPFVIQGNKWEKNTINYYFQNGTIDIDNDDEQLAFYQAFHLWSDVTNLEFHEVFSTLEADIVILFGSRAHGDNYPFDGQGGVLAHAYFPPPNGDSLAGDLHLDEDESWSLSMQTDPWGAIDLVTVAAHEIGHSLGLDHSRDQAALMYPYYYSSQRYLSEDDIDGIQEIYGDNISFWTSSFTRQWTTDEHIRVLSDVNGDGKADIVGFHRDKVYVSLSNGESFETSQVWTNSFSSLWNNTSHIRTLADVDGDGKKDIVGFGDHRVYVSLSTGTNFEVSQVWTSSFTSGWNNSSHIRALADVNGDGKADIVGFHGDKVYVSLSNGESFETSQVWTNSFSNLWNNSSHIRTLADVNGDGKDDIVGFGDQKVYVALSTGQSFDTSQVWSHSFTSLWSTTRHIRTLNDINGDGKEDIVGFGDYKVYVSLSNGNRFETSQEWTKSFSNSEGWNNTEHVRTIGDVDGDGKSDVVGFGDNRVSVLLNSKF